MKITEQVILSWKMTTTYIHHMTYMYMYMQLTSSPFNKREDSFKTFMNTYFINFYIRQQIEQINLQMFVFARTVRNMFYAYNRYVSKPILIWHSKCLQMFGTSSIFRYDDYTCITCVVLDLCQITVDIFARHFLSSPLE